jgi:5-hydroxyisourate hydrolase-like protein (transthyretin family)
MILAITAFSLLLQAPAPVQQPPARASLAGVVVQARNGEPIPNVQVTLARVDAKLGAFADMVGGDHPPFEMVIPAEFLTTMKESAAADVTGGAAGNPAEAAAIAALQVDDFEQIIVSPTGQVAVVYKSAPPVLSDSRGRFVFNNVESGTYRVIFSGPGYAKQDYGQRAAGGGTPINLKPGDARTDLVMRMSQVGAISGRIQDNMGQPAAGIPVQLFRFVYDENGQRNPRTVASANTNDRGEYRFFFLSPGRYYVKAGNEPGQTRPAELQGAPFNVFGAAGYVSPNRISQNYAITYFPGVPDANAAAAVDLQSGAELSGIDLNLTPQQAYRVRGRVVDPRTGRPPASAIVQLRAQTRADDISSFILASMSGSGSYNPTDGSFDVRNVAPGSYTLSVDIPNSRPTPPVDVSALSPADRAAFFEAQSAAERVRPRASVPVNVINTDIDNLSIAIGVTSGISGRVRVDASASNVPRSLDFTRVTLRPADGSPFPLQNAPQFRPPKADGTFRMENLWPGEYRLVVAGLPEAFYVKEARLGNADVLNSPLHFSGDDSMSLDVVISPKAGKIEGAVVDARRQAASGASVVLIPVRGRERTDLFRTVTADANGRFAMSSIAPGDYRLVAWEAIEPFAYFDPDLIRQAEQNGVAIRVTESSQQTVNLTAF